MDVQNWRREGCSGSGAARVMQGRRSFIGASAMNLVFLTVFLGSSYAGATEWTSHFYNDVLGNNAEYLVINKDRTVLRGLTVYRDQVYVKTWPHTWTDLISIEVEGTPLRKMFFDGDRDFSRTLGNIVFVVTGDSAKEIIRAFAKGTSITIKDCGLKGEPTFVFPLQGFNAAYERAMAHHD
jgi:hypothetical protein